MDKCVDRDIWVAHAKYADGTEIRRVFPYPIYFSVAAEERAEKRIIKWLTETVAEKHGECTYKCVHYSDTYYPPMDGPEYDPNEEI